MLPQPLPPNEALADVFQYTPADLRANRRGTISERQKERMRARHAETVVLMEGFFAFVAIIGVLGSGAAALNAGIPVWQMWFALLMGFGFWVSFAGAILAYSRRRLEQTIAAGEVAKLRGRLHLRWAGGKTTQYYFCVGARRFSIPTADYIKLERSKVDGLEATVYYTTRWEWVLAVELAP